MFNMHTGHKPLTTGVYSNITTDTHTQNTHFLFVTSIPAENSILSNLNDKLQK